MIKGEVEVFKDLFSGEFVVKEKKIDEVTGNIFYVDIAVFFSEERAHEYKNVINFLRKSVTK